MKRLASLAFVAIALAGCGGGSDTPPPPPVPSVALLSGSIARTVAAGTSVAIDVAIKPNFTPTGTLHATATEASGVIGSAVEVKAGTDGSYTLSLASSAAASVGTHAGSLTLNLCADPACATPQPVPSLTVNFDINVLSASSAWPGGTLSALAGWPGAPDWSMFQGNAAHTGYVPVTLNPDQFSPRWRSAAVSAPGSRYELRSTLTTADGQFFVAGDTFLYARKEHDGSAVWQYDVGSLAFPSVNPPAVANGKVYMAAGQQSSTFLFAFDAATGALQFKAPMSAQWEYYLAPTIGEQGVYTNAGTYGGLYGFDPLGQPLYFANMAQTSVWTPAVDATGVYSYTGGMLTVTDPRTGAVLHTISDPSFTNYVYEIGGAPVLGAPGSVFVANYENALLNGGAIGNTLLSFRVGPDSIAWQVPGVYLGTPAYASGVLYVTNQNPVRLEARAEADGALLWSWIPPLAGDTTFNSEVLLTKNLVFVSSNLATYAIDTASHRTVWSYPQHGRLALSKNGVLYIQGQDFLTAINLK
jgi:outer membrane protein assembly factor BamB